jgi:hypothetical protein
MEASGRSFTNETHDGSWNAIEESAASALLNFAGN